MYAGQRRRLREHGSVSQGNTAFEQCPVLIQSTFAQKRIDEKSDQGADTSRQLPAGRIDELRRGAGRFLPGQDCSRAPVRACLA